MDEAQVALEVQRGEELAQRMLTQRMLAQHSPHVCALTQNSPLLLTEIPQA
jgi:hypothetical protein